MIGGTDNLMTTADWERLFPFHFMFGRDMAVLGVGHSLPKFMPDIVVGTPLASSITINRPPIPLTFDDVAAHTKALFVLCGQKNRQIGRAHV